MRIFIAGATGVIGRRLVPLLTAQGHQVTGLARTDAAAGQLRVQGAAAALAPRRVTTASIQPSLLMSVATTPQDLPGF